MSTSTAPQASSPISPGPAPAPAPWRSLFLEHLSKLDSPEFVLSTLSRAATGASTPFVPRARYCIYRGMWGEIPYNQHYDAATYGKNEARYESDMLTLTTDARMEKTSHILLASSDAAADDNEGDIDADGDSPSSGGGGPVEAVFWIKDVMTQWRFKGEAYMIGPDMDGTALPREDHVRSVKAKLLANMRGVADQSSDRSTRWSWQQEWHSHFGNLSPLMRGSFQNAPPGKPLGKVSGLPKPLAVPLPAPSSAGLGHGQGQKITGSLMAPENAMARRNFRVVVICATDVERLDLDLQRRWRWRRRRRRASGNDRDRESGKEMKNEQEKENQHQQHHHDAVSGLATSSAEGNPRMQLGLGLGLGLRQLDEGENDSRDAAASQWIMEELWP